MKSALLIAGIAVRELLHERVVYILVSFSVVCLGVSVLLGQLTYAEQAKLTLDFMLGATQLSLILFSIFMGISLFHREFQMGSISMVLSKPIARGSFLLGKYLGQTVVQAGILTAMACITVLVLARYEGNLPLAPIFQCSLLIFLESICVTAITYFFAVNAGALTSAVATLCVLIFSHLREPISKTLGQSGDYSAWRLLKTLIPDLEVFNMKSLASYGLTLPTQEVAWILVYALCCVAYFLFMAVVCFNKKDILT